MDCWQPNMLKWPNVATVFTGCHYRIIKQYIMKAFKAFLFFSLTNCKVVGACRFLDTERVVHRCSCCRVFKHIITCDIEETRQKAIPKSTHLVPHTSVDLQTISVEDDVFLLTDREQRPAFFAVALPFVVHVGITAGGLKLWLEST